jgi:Uma2 family endonuclease
MPAVECPAQPLLRGFGMSAVMPLARHKLSVDDYHRMGAAGVLAPDCRVELIEGEMIDMAPIGSVHASVVSVLSAFFVRAVGEAGIVFSQNPVRLLPDSEPQPDLMVLKPRADHYRKSLPLAADVLLLGEVADSTLDYDRKIKLPLYARHGIAEVWIVDLNAERLEVHAAVQGGAYGSVRRLEKTESVTPGLVPCLPLPLAAIWPA